MATIKVACLKCGQKVSGDESFYGTVVECPICSASIQFPGQRREPIATGPIDPVPTPEQKPPEPQPASSAAPNAQLPESVVDDAVPQTQTAPQGASPAPPPQAFSEEKIEGESLPPSPLTGAVSIVTAVLAVVTCPLGLLFAPIAIICGHLSQAKARRSPIQPAPGQTLGAIGMLIGYIWLVIAILLLAIAAIFKEPLREPIQELLNNAFPNES